MNSERNIEQEVKDVCHQRGLRREHIECGVGYARDYYEHSRCFSISVRHGVELAENLERVNR